MSSSSAPPQRTQRVLQHESAGVTGSAMLLWRPGPLPDHDSVRKEVARVPTVRADVEQAPIILLQDPRTGEVLRDPAPRSLAFIAQLHCLFAYSYLTNPDDVPADLLEMVAWALQVFMDVFTEATDAQLLATGFILSSEIGAAATCIVPEAGTGLSNGRLVTRLQVKAKLARFLLKPELNRPGDAVKYMREFIEHVCSHTPAGQILSKDHIRLMFFAEALTYNGEDDTMAETLLTHLVDSLLPGLNGLEDLVINKVYLSRVLRRNGKAGAAKKHEKWLIKWFLKNPHQLFDETLREILMPDGQTGPILEALGGPSWLDGRKHTDETDRRLGKQCGRCFAREPMVKLLACSRCKSLYYCSRECQKADWPLHKGTCKNIINMNQHIERLSLTDPSAAQKAKHWLEWQMSIDSWAYASALRLQKNPGRAHTHLVLEKSVYTPDAGPLATDKFTIVGCTVLRIADMLGHIELGMKLGPGEGAGLCMSVLQDRREVGPGNPLIPFLIIRLDGGIVNMSLGRGFVATKQLEETEYNPNWRQDVNKARPPPPKFQYRNCRDAEFD